jgi:uncharacterized SAM-binding protein YcdF (DUF218 family)
MFLYERFLASFFTPMPIILIFLIISLIMIIVGRKILFAKLLLTFSVILLIIFSYTSLPRYMISAEEDTYKPHYKSYTEMISKIANSGKPVKWVVVLGGGVSNDGDLPVSSKLSSASMIRLIEGIRLMRKFAGSKLLISGGGPKSCETKEASVMRELALDLGVKAEDIVIERESSETFEQARNIRYFVRNDNVILVTSAMHISRAEKMFKKFGINYFPLPTDFLIKKSCLPSSNYYLPNSEGINMTERALYEYWAGIGASLKGQY